jgi:hypothetical protein
VLIDTRSTPPSEKEEEKNILRKKADDEESQKLNAAQVMGIVSVLIATLTFAAAFTLPGGYRSADDSAAPPPAPVTRSVAGMPVLGGKSNYLFKTFILADTTMAFICSSLATFALIFAGVPAMELPVRVKYIQIKSPTSC